MSTPFDLRLRPHKVGSVCLPFRLGPYVTIQRDPVAQEGAAVACRVLSARKTYGHLELPSGRHAPLIPGDIIVGVLGNRAALRGFCGRVPQRLSQGDTIQLLNQGGVIGQADGGHAGLGHPIQLEVLGTPVRLGVPLLLADHALAPATELPRLPPILALIGTCMHAGKTTAAAAIIRYLRSQGQVIHAGKLTGVASVGDLLTMADNGANRTLSFLDCGIPSTCYRSDVPQTSRTLLYHLARESPDVMVLEMGDGLMGAYGVDEILGDPIISRAITSAVLAANDVIGATAAAERLAGFGIPVQLIVGPATDSVAGSKRLADLGLAAINMLMHPEEACRQATAALHPPRST